MTQQGINGARFVDPFLPIRPLLGFGVNNSNSCFHRKLIDLGVDIRSTRPSERSWSS